MRRKIPIQPALACILLCAGITLGQMPDRTKPPVPGPLPGLGLPQIQHLWLSNHLPVILLEKHNLPLLQVEVVVRAGSVADPEGKSGLASLTAQLMEDGAGTRNSLEYADAVDFLGATISAFAGWHSCGVSLHTPVSNLDSALALLADMVLRPRFPAEELERERNDRLTTMMQWRDEPEAIASILSQKVIYGDLHPYGTPVMGTAEGIRRITLGDIKGYYSSYFRGNNATVIVVGDISAKGILPKLEWLFGRWPEGEIPKISLPEPQQVRKIVLDLVDKPGSAQSEIILTRIGAPRGDPDYFALQVMNDILGGAFTSRLNQNLREEHGYAYDASSLFDCRLLPGPFTAHAAVQTSVTDSAIMEFMNELKAIREPVRDDELLRAKNYITLRYPRNFESVENIADRLVELAVYNLPDEYFNTYADHILRVDKEDVLRTSRKYIDPENIAIIVVGDRKKIEQGILDLHLAPVHTMEVDDVLGKSAAPGVHQ